MNWILENWLEISAALTGIVTAASVIIKITPTKSDDNFWAKYVKPLVNALALNPKEKK